MFTWDSYLVEYGILAPALLVESVAASKAKVEAWSKIAEPSLERYVHAKQCWSYIHMLRLYTRCSTALLTYSSRYAHAVYLSVRPSVRL